MDNNRNYRSVNGFTIIIFMVIVFGALWMANRMQMHRQEMTYTEFVKQVEAENVTEVYIDQNKAVPTGTVVFALKDTDENRSVNVSNVEKVEKLLDKNEVLYQVSAIPETSMLSSVLLPTVITLGGIMLLFFLMNRQGNGANAKAMNFGKSRARMTNHDEIKVTFANVAGGRERRTCGDRRFFESAEKICAGRRSYSERRFVGRTSGNRKNTSCKSCCRRGGSAVFQYFGFGFCGNVRRCRRISRA